MPVTQSTEHLDLTGVTTSVVPLVNSETHFSWEIHFKNHTLANGVCRGKELAEFRMYEYYVSDALATRLTTLRSLDIPAGWTINGWTGPQDHKLVGFPNIDFSTDDHYYVITKNQPKEGDDINGEWLVKVYPNTEGGSRCAESDTVKGLTAAFSKASQYITTF